jgi:hypothetical protein
VHLLIWPWSALLGSWAPHCLHPAAPTESGPLLWALPRWYFHFCNDWLSLESRFKIVITGVVLRKCVKPILLGWRNRFFFPKTICLARLVQCLLYLTFAGDQPEACQPPHW